MGQKDEADRLLKIREINLNIQNYLDFVQMEKKSKGMKKVLNGFLIAYIKNGF